jgi:hypothetical protein
MSQSDQRYDPSTREKMSKIDWDEVFPRVLKYAKSRAWKFSQSGIDADPLAMINEAVARAYGIGTRGTFRNWDEANCPKAYNFLIGIIRSITSHEAEHLSEFTPEPILKDDGIINEKMQETSRSPDPEEKLIEEENEQPLLDELKRISAEDEELGMIILCIEDGISKASEIAEETGYEILKVYSLQRKLRLILKDFNPGLRK